MRFCMGPDGDQRMGAPGGKLAWPPRGKPWTSASLPQSLMALEVENGVNRYGDRSATSALACLSGRVDHVFDTISGRLVEELRLAGIPSTEAANTWLPKFIRTHNAR